jgi:hypothetical protein
VNSAAYLLRNFHEKRNPARSRRAGRAAPRPSPLTVLTLTAHH